MLYFVVEFRKKTFKIILELIMDIKVQQKQMQCMQAELLHDAHLLQMSSGR